MNAIAELMKRNGTAQKELALAIGVSQPTISDWMNGKKTPKGDNVIRLANYFNVSTDVINGLVPLTYVHWKESQELLDDPDRRALLDFAKYGKKETVKSIADIIRDLKATNPDYYDGDDPA